MPFRVAGDRLAAPTILVLGAIVVAGPLLAAVLLDRGYPTWQAVSFGVLVQLGIALLVPGAGSRLHRSAIGLAYAGSSWVLVVILREAFRASGACGINDHVGTGNTAVLVVTAAAALAAVVVAFLVAAMLRVPHVGIVLAVGTAFGLALLIVPRLDNYLELWDALGHHYIPSEAYAVACRNHNMYVDSLGRRITPAARR